MICNVAWSVARDISLRMRIRRQLSGLMPCTTTGGAYRKGTKTSIGSPQNQTLSIFTSMGVSFTRGISSVSLAFTHRMQNRLS